MYDADRKRQVNQWYVSSVMSAVPKLTDTIAGRSLVIVPRSVAKEGYKDIDKDDYTEDDGHDGYFKRTQDTQLVIIEDRWRDDYKVRVYKE